MYNHRQTRCSLICRLSAGTRHLYLSFSDIRQILNNYNDSTNLSLSFFLAISSTPLSFPRTYTNIHGLSSFPSAIIALGGRCGGYNSLFVGVRRGVALSF